jgi:hypothetical protein
LYLIVAGLVLGLLLGPAVLGRLAPQRYLALFPSVESARADLEAFDRNLSDLARQLAATGATGAAADELRVQMAPQRLPLVTALIEAKRSAGRLPAVTLALAALMVIEAAGGSVLARRLVTVRFALIALWIALLLAQPAALADVPIAFAGLVLVVALVAGLVPLPRRSGARA